jgi:hypothetical protein
VTTCSRRSPDDCRTFQVGRRRRRRNLGRRRHRRNQTQIPGKSALLPSISAWLAHPHGGRVAARASLISSAVQPRRGHDRRPRGAASTVEQFGAALTREPHAQARSDRSASAERHRQRLFGRILHAARMSLMLTSKLTAEQIEHLHAHTIGVLTNGATRSLPRRARSSRTR